MAVLEELKRKIEDTDVSSVGENKVHLAQAVGTSEVGQAGRWG